MIVKNLIYKNVRSPLQNCLPHNPTYFQNYLETSLQEYRESLHSPNPIIEETGSFETLPEEVQTYVRNTQAYQNKTKEMLSFWKEVSSKQNKQTVPLPDCTIDFNETFESLPNTNPSENLSLRDKLESQLNNLDRGDSSMEANIYTNEIKSNRGPKSQQKSRIQDKRFQRPTNNILVSDMIDLPHESDNDPEYQEAIRLSLLESDGFITPSKNSKYNNQEFKNGKSRDNIYDKNERKNPRNKNYPNTSKKNNESNGNLKMSSKDDTSTQSLSVSKPKFIEIEEFRCLICDELFDTEKHLYAIGSCNHACICGVSIFQDIFFILLLFVFIIFF